MCQQAEGIGVALEVEDVLPLLLGELRTQQLLQSAVFAEERAYGLFAAVPERRIADVVTQTRRSIPCRRGARADRSRFRGPATDLPTTPQGCASDGCGQKCSPAAETPASCFAAA